MHSTVEQFKLRQWGRKLRQYAWLMAGFLALGLTVGALVVVVQNTMAVEKQRHQFYRTLELTMGRTTLMNYIMRLDDFQIRKQGIFLAVAAAGLSGVGILLMFFLMSRLYQQLQAEQRKKTEMIGMITHNARHYLNLIKGRTYLLKSKWERAAAPPLEGNSEVERIDENTVSLQQLVEDLSNNELLSTGQVRPEFKPIQVKELWEQMLNDFANMIRKQNLQVEFLAEDPPTSLESDQHLLEQVMMNLLDNAIKYSPVGGRLKIWSILEGQWYKVFIQNQGPGIAVADQEKIFRPFIRLNTHVRGTGLGLSNARQFMELLGGELGIAASQPGQGSIFYFTLPYVPVRQHTKETDHV